MVPNDIPYPKDIQILESHPEKFNPMFGLKEENGRGENESREGENVKHVIDFLTNLVHFFFYHSIQTVEMI